MSWRLEDHERAALAGVAHDKFRKDVIAHAKRKAVFEPPLPDSEYEKLARMIYDRVDGLLRKYDTATYESYVLMMLVYFGYGVETVEGPLAQQALRNERFGINTRVRVAYDLMRLFMKEGL